jgi:hypothetical protein
MMDGGQMDIEQRIEALTQSVELLASLQKDSDKRVDRLIEQMSRFGQHAAQLEIVVVQIGDATNALMQVVHDHEERIAALEAK